MRNFTEFSLAALWFGYGFSTIISGGRKYAEPRGKKLVRAFGWGEIVVSLLMYVTWGVQLHTTHQRAALIIFYALASLPILLTGAYGFIYQRVTGDGRANRLCWALLVFCLATSALFFCLNLLFRL